MKNMRLYLVRHGITEGNFTGIYMGSGTDEPLCEEGRAQLAELRELFVYPQPDTIFASPMQRALQTADLLFPRANNKITLQDLRENDFGEFEGRRLDELVHDAHFKQWMTPGAKYRPEGGESAADFNKRCSTVLMSMFEYMAKAKIEEAACVTHGGVIMSMLAQRGLPRYAPEHWMADSGCGYEVQCSTAYLMRDGMAEITDIVPYGYLEGKEA